MQQFQAGYTMMMTRVLLLALAGATKNPELLKLQGMPVPTAALLVMLKNSGSQNVAKTKADAAEIIQQDKDDNTPTKVTYGYVNGKKTAGTMQQDDQGVSTWTPAKGDEGAPPKPASPTAGLRTDEDANKSAQYWNDKVEKSEDRMLGTFQKKLGLPEGAGLADTIQAWAGLSDSKKDANRAAFKLAISQYESDRNNYNKKAPAAGLDPRAEDTETLNQLKALVGGGKPPPADPAKRQKAIDYLTKNKAPVTDKNIAYIMSQQSGD